MSHARTELRLSDDALATAAEARAAGRSWDEAAAAVGRTADELRRAARTDPRYDAAYALAERERDREADAEGMHLLRAQLKDEDKNTARRAAEVIARYAGQRRREETRLEIERMRLAERAAERAARDKRARGDGFPEPDDTPWPDGWPTPTGAPAPAPMSAEEARRANAAFLADQAGDAARLSREELPVHLWGGKHPMVHAEPDETDTPVVLVTDVTAAGQVVYWAVASPPPTHPADGPFPAKHEPPVVAG